MKIVNNEKRLLQLILICLLFCGNAFRMADTNNLVREKGNLQDSFINDSVVIKKNITSFLKWYKINMHKANSFPLLTKDSKGYVMIDKKACTDYLNYLKSSKLVSAKYIGYWKRYLDDKAETLKKDKIKDDVPEGFDFDFVLITQEPEIILNKIDSLQITTISMKNNVAVMGVKLISDGSVDYQFEMAKTPAGWQIEYISTSNYD